MHEMVTADLGPGFHGFRGLIDGKLVCVATPQVLHDAAARRIMRDLVRRQGGDCDACRRCLMGRHD